MEAADYFTASNQIAVDALDTVTRNLGRVSAEDHSAVWMRVIMDFFLILGEEGHCLNGVWQLHYHWL